MRNELDYGVAVVDEPVILVSDIHCRAGSCRAAEVARIAEGIGARLVVLGDLFDDLHRPVHVNTLAAALKAAFRGVGELELYYVTSRSSHDPIVDRQLNIKVGGLCATVYPKALVAELGRLRAFLTHGDMALRNGAHAFLVNLAAGAFGIRLYLERRLRSALCLPNGWWLVMGHTHIPGIDYEAQIANVGSWRQQWGPATPYWRPPSNTLILVEGSNIKLSTMLQCSRSARVRLSLAGDALSASWGR